MCSILNKSNLIKNKIIVKQLHKGAEFLYFIRKGIPAIFLSAMPVPLTTARSGSSATCTGNFIL